MSKEDLEYLINYSVNTGCDYSEIYYEKVTDSTSRLISSKIDSVTTSILEGVGIRISKGEDILYAHTNDISKDNLINIIDKLKENYCNEKTNKKIYLEEKSHVDIEINNLSINDKKEIFHKIDAIARKKSKLVSEVTANINEVTKDVTVASSKGKITHEKRVRSRLNIGVFSLRNGRKEYSSKNYGYTKSSDFIKSLDLNHEIDLITESAIKKLDSVSITGKEMPVILEKGFGAVIFHEACGHAMEATTVSKNISVLSSKIGEKIASDKVTIIDDPTIDGAFGSTYFDDEGNKTQKNVLIKNGVLVSYLIDELNAVKMKSDITNSGRRQSYNYPPTSRMNNTFLAPGNDKVEDMFKDIKYGLYAKSMDGGTVDPVTGNFNFTVNEGYVIRNGKICEPVKMASLIGNTLDILKNVDMVSDNLKLETGYCGSISGSIPVCIGQPTIRVSKILVGGLNE